MLTLGIETSCDETGVALLDEDGRVAAAAVASQDQIHAPYAGVVPELASRQHLRLLGPLVARVLAEAGLSSEGSGEGRRLGGIGLVAVTRGPGLAGCLLAGVGFAKSLAYGAGVPLVGVNHIEAHLYSCALEGGVEFPAVGLVVSGGHTLLVLIREWGRYEILGRTQDDAVGEAYDKVASMLGLGFPGGPAIEVRAGNCARAGEGERFPRPLLGSGGLDFSFSGLKTAVLYRLRKPTKGGGGIGTPRPGGRGKAGPPGGGVDLRDRADAAFPGEREIDCIARGFQDAVVEVLVAKTIDAAEGTGARCVLLAGGVARNEALRGGLESAVRGIGLPLVCAPRQYCTDNGVMVAALGRRMFESGARSGMDLDIAPGLGLGL